MFAKRFILTLLLMAWTMTVSAQGTPTTESWAVRMFSEMGTVRTHDFGSVALHAKVEHRFPFKNIYKEDIVIQSAASNCGCTKVSVTKTLLHPGETAEIVARVDTSGKEHTKRRKATITVRFSKPSYAEVQLQITTYIRPDVGFEPGLVEFGTVPKGKIVTKKVLLQYEGQSNWGLTAIRKSSSAIKAEAKEVSRQNGRIVYEITVSLNDSAPSGYLNDLLRFTTNEVNANQTSVFLPIHGLVMEPLTAKPSYFQFGVVHPGESVTKNLVVRGSKPFRISSIKADDSRMSFLVAKNESVVHVIPVTFVADQRTGEVSQSINIVTNQTDLDPVSVHVTGYVSRTEEIAQVPDTEPIPETTAPEENLLNLELPDDILSPSEAVAGVKEQEGSNNNSDTNSSNNSNNNRIVESREENNPQENSEVAADDLLLMPNQPHLAMPILESGPKPLKVEEVSQTTASKESGGWRSVANDDLSTAQASTATTATPENGSHAVQRPTGTSSSQKPAIQFRAPSRLK